MVAYMLLLFLPPHLRKLAQKTGSNIIEIPSASNTQPTYGNKHSLDRVQEIIHRKIRQLKSKLRDLEHTYRHNGALPTGADWEKYAQLLLELKKLS